MKRKYENLISRSKDNSHNDFVRQFPHIEGNWPCHIYIPVNIVNDYIIPIKNQLNEYFDDIKGDWIDEDNYHISLSKPFVLKKHYINNFINDLNNDIINIFKFVIDILLSEYQILVNESKSRAFLCLSIDSGTKELNKLVKCIDTTLNKYKQPVYYEDPKFHVSLASLSLMDSNNINSSTRISINSQPTICFNDIANYNDLDDDDYHKHIQLIVDDEDKSSQLETTNRNDTTKLYNNDSKIIRITVDKIICKIGYRKFIYDLQDVSDNSSTDTKFQEIDNIL